MSDKDATAHLDAAIAALSLEAWNVGPDGHEERISHFTIAEDLKRVDGAIGPAGESMFARLADAIEEAYVEILAAKRSLEPKP